MVNRNPKGTITGRLFGIAAYGLACDGDRLWLLSRDEDGTSILYEITAGRAAERLRAKEALEDFAVSGQTFYATEQESGEVLVYPIPAYSERFRPPIPIPAENWPASVGMTGRNRSEYAKAFDVYTNREYFCI